MSDETTNEEQDVEYEAPETRELLVQGVKEFKVRIPAKAKITFGPFSPPSGKQGYAGPDDRKGTLRVYESAKPGASIIAMFSGVTSFRSVDIDYSEKIAVEEGATIWKSDQNGYERSEKKKVVNQWVDPSVTPQLTDGKAE